MARKRLRMRQIREVLRLKAAGLPHREIARSCGMGAATVADYVVRATAAGLTWPLPDELDDGALEARLFPRGTEAPAARPAPDPAHLHQELQRGAGVTLLLLWEEYRQGHPEGLGYSQFCEHYRRWRRRLKPSMRQAHRAGERTFTDFSGKKPSVVDRATGVARKVELFVSALGVSSLTYAEARESQELASWQAMHVHMAEYAGGVTEIWVPDNLKSAVTASCRYEPVLNGSFADIAEHYGVAIIPARAGKPKDKAKVESNVLVVQRWILARLRNRTFFSLAELNAAIRELVDDLNERPMRATGKSRRQLFEELDRPALKPLPPMAFEPREWKRCKVHEDYHVQVADNYYSVPYQPTFRTC
jgi:transposase